MILRNTSDEDMGIGCPLDRYFKEIEEYGESVLCLNYLQLINYFYPCESQRE